MTDDEIERVLREFAPAAPPASLRARVLTIDERPRDRWLWIAAAAMVIAAAGVHAQASRTIESAVDRPVDVAATDQAQAEWMASVAGDDLRVQDALRRALATQGTRDDSDAGDRPMVAATWIH